MKKQINQAFTLSLILSIYFNAVLVVLKELNPQFKGFLKTALMHHWLGHGVFLLLFFVVLGLFFNRLNLNLNLRKMSNQIVVSIVVSGLGISIFYLNHVH